MLKELLLSALEKVEEMKAKKKQTEKPKPAPRKTSTAPVVQKVDIDIPVATIVKVVLVVAIFLALTEIFLQIQTWLVIGAICFFLAMGLSPIVDAIERHHIPRPVAILILYVLFFAVLGVLFVEMIPIIAEQLGGIARDIKSFVSNGHSSAPILDKILNTIQFDPQQLEVLVADNLASMSQKLQSVVGSTFGILTSIFAGLFNFIFALVLLFFILLEREEIGEFALMMFSPKNRKYIRAKALSVQSKMASWFKGQVILMISMGLFMYFGMKMFEVTLGMKYAATIGLLAAVMELFPYIGVLLTGLLAGLIALNESWILLLAVIGWIAIAQFLEGNFLVPIVMEKVVGLSSVAVMLALAMGGTLGYALGGVPLLIIGMILSVPIGASLALFVQEYAHREDH